MLAVLRQAHTVQPGKGLLQSSVINNSVKRVRTTGAVQRPSSCLFVQLSFCPFVDGIPPLNVAPHSLRSRSG